MHSRRGHVIYRDDCGRDQATATDWGCTSGYRHKNLLNYPINSIQCKVNIILTLGLKVGLVCISFF